MIKIQDSGHKTQDSRHKTQDSLLATVLCLVSCIFLFWGCSEPKDKIVIPPEDKLPSVKEPLKAYHPTEFLSTEIRSAPILSQASHPDGWKKTDCTQCHRSPSKEAPAICTDCHGKNGVGDQVDTCRSCHKVQSEFGEPASGNHQVHVIEGPKDTSCIKCHTGGPEQSKSHANGILDIRIINDGKYTSLTTPQNGVTGSCSNIICHPDVRNWGGDCSSCHYDPPDTGLHKEHLEQGNISCQACHLGNKHDSDKTSGEIELGGIDYNSITGDCTSTCHSKPLNWTCTDCHGYPPDTGNHTSDDHRVGCGECHSGHTHSYKAATRPLDFSETEVRFAQGGTYRYDAKSCSSIACHSDERIWGSSCTDCHGNPPDTSTHLLHVQGKGLKCQDCHSDNQHDLDNQSGSIETGGIVYDSLTGDCTSTCHDEQKWDCTDCHGFPPDSGNHLAHDSDCGECHQGHEHSYKAALEPTDFTEVQVSIADGGQFNSSNKSCSNVSCHETRTWGENCAACHLNPPETGTHLLHVQEQKLSCQDCHEGNQHDSDVNSGSIELGGIGYNAFTGDCTSTCHGQRQWNCTECHGNPPDTGNHPDHELDCEQCHQGHQHSYRAAMSPRDFSSIQVDMVVSGSFDPGSKTCSNVECHTDARVWGENCAACHLNPPETGTHLLHVQEQKLSCQDCHEGNQHDSDVNSGSIELGGIGYNAFTGDCTSTCHGQRQWNCTECHGNPPDTGNHPDHELDCEQCHQGHQHSYRAAMSPRDFSSIQVDMVVSGSFDPGSKTCSNVECHTDARVWGENCAACHLNPPETGTHLLHVRDQKLSCQDCHEGNQHDSDVNSGSIELGGIGYNAFTGDCTSTCHGQRQWNCTECHGDPPDTGNHPDHELNCEQCHQGHQHSYRAAMSPRDFSSIQVDFIVSGSFDSGSKTCSNVECHTDARFWGENCAACHLDPPETGTHLLHVREQELSCQSCHEGNQHDLDVNSGSIELGGIEYDALTGDCFSSCHAERRWNCTDCHEYPPDTGTHPSHNQPSGKFFSSEALGAGPTPCAECHLGHLHSYKAAMAPEEFFPIQVDFERGGTFDPTNGICSNLACHESMKWGGSCSDCHGAPPETGLHQIHIQSGLNCTLCHEGNQHDLDVNSGVIDIGGTVYNLVYEESTGSCASSCHAKKELWGCTSCHGFPPDAGQHKAHDRFTCNICHSEHKHTYKSATSPLDFGDAKVGFAIGGDWDKVTGTCNSIGCHEDRKW